ncbi:hypothetical protein [Legionella taurinensis]|uniref:hypothetical protein n=1 Tax=Legionella taurinensis TaxID=70611 RepID=UPI00299DAECE|nr:hypothetical protein [Legionella taurinensis]MDX1837280.1 hypothetical protein [Legionella taurinensis]
MKKAHLVLVFIFTLPGVLMASPDTCVNNPSTQEKASQELQQLARDDQADRDDWENMTDEQREQMSIRDLQRRQRVGALFGAGCLKTSHDYLAASLIYQHGDVSDHYYQAYLWAKRAIDSGETGAKSMIAPTIDRYLVSINQKQLFGSQLFIKNISNLCGCLEPVEEDFPDDKRIQWSGLSLKDRYDLLQAFNEGKNCSSSLICPHDRLPTPEGAVPGVW